MDLLETEKQESREVVEAYKSGQRPPLKIDLDDWADQYRYINDKRGRWKTSRVEIARGMMKAVTERGVRTITAMTCTQVAKTELILNTTGYFMHVDPCPILIVLPSDKMSKKFSNIRISRMLKATPVLRDMVHESGQRSSRNTVNYKEFPGGEITMVGSKVPEDLSSQPIRLCFMDEIDKFEESTGEEGDPVDLAEERMSTYTSNSLSIRTCSPTLKGMSRIEDSYESSDMRKPFVLCPHCDKYQILVWGQVKWSKNKKGVSLPHTAQYCCSHCGVLWTESERKKALYTVQWRQTSPFMCSLCEHENDPSKWGDNDFTNWKQDREGPGHVFRAYCEECGKGKCSNRHAGFWASKLYGPFRNLAYLVQKWMDAQGNIQKLKAFINMHLAETFEEAGDRISSIDGLLGRREKYPELPYEVGVITAGIDVQGNRIEGEVIGWGKDEESWSLKHFVLTGDPAQPYIWQKLEVELEKPYWREDGNKLSYIAAACIDLGGGHTQQVANFCRDKVERRFWPIRGTSTVGRAIPVWPRKAGRTDKIQVPFYNIGVDAAKNVIFSRLLIPEGRAGFCHFPLNRDADWFEQLTAERRVKKYKGTQLFYVWDNPKRKRNEAFDCRVYGYAALCGLQSEGLQVNMITEDQLFIMDADFDEERRVMLEQKDSSESVRSESKPKRRVRMKKSSFMNS